MQVLAAWERSRGGLPLMGAYPGIVAMKHVGGMTDHRLAGIPVNVDPSSPATSSITRGSDMGKLHLASSCVGMDEFVMHP